VRRGDTAVRILDAVQELDQQVAPPRRVAQQGLHLGERRASTWRPLGTLLAARFRPSRDVSITDSWASQFETDWDLGLGCRMRLARGLHRL